jgi:hypothetical protein
VRDGGPWGGPPSQYVRAVSLDVRHPYYNLRSSDGVCEDLALAPTRETAERLARYGLLWRRRGDGGDILAPTSLALALEAELAPGRSDWPGGLARLVRGPPLLFTATVARPAFVGRTQIPAEAECGRLSLCLSNRRSRRIADSPGPAGTSLADLDPDWSRSVATAAAFEEAERLSDEAAGRPERKPNVAAIADWAATPEAEHVLREAARQATGSRERRLPFALVEIFMTAPGEGSSVYPISIGSGARGGGEIVPVRYRIPFEARRTRWRYVVGTRGTVDPSTLRIGEAARAPLAFVEDEPALGSLAGAVETRAVLSGEAITLAQSPQRRFFLEGRPKGGRRGPVKLIDPLPAPAADALLHRGSNDGERVSEIYVYV